MMTFLLIIFAFASAIVTLAGLFLPFKTGNRKYFLLYFIGAAMIIGTIYFERSNIPKSPTKQDVLDGKAYYQEIQVIVNDDTIKTYEIVWKQKN